MVIRRDRRKPAVPSGVHGSLKALPRETLVAEVHQWQVDAEIHSGHRVAIWGRGAPRAVGEWKPSASAPIENRCFPCEAAMLPRVFVSNLRDGSGSPLASGRLGCR